MSQPARKSGQQPESYCPKDAPEIMKLLEDYAQNNAESIFAQQSIRGGSPMKPADYDFQFSGFRGLDFTNCFTSLYLYLEGIRGVDDYDCAKKRGEPCRHPGCHHRCSLTLHNHAGQHFFLFDTVSGRSAAVHGWGGKPTDVYREIYDSDDMVDFVMGYAGYAYEKYAEDLADRIRASLDNGIPVLARLKKDKPYTDLKSDSFRIIIGYDGNKLRAPEPKGAQKARKRAPKLREIDSVYVITGRTERKYTLLDALRRIKRVMDADRGAKVWDDYIHAFEDYHNKLQQLGRKEFKRLFEFAHMGTTWNCHNFVEAFRTYCMNPQCPERFETRVWDELKDPRLGELCNRIDYVYDDSHTRQWQLHSLYETRNWRKKYYSGLDWGMCETAADILRKIKKDDDACYGAVCEMIGILEEGAK